MPLSESPWVTLITASGGVNHIEIPIYRDFFLCYSIGVLKNNIENFLSGILNIGINFDNVQKIIDILSKMSIIKVKEGSVMDYKNHLKEIESHFEMRMLDFESRKSIDKITYAVSKIPGDLLGRSINEYQHIIRCNDWYFPNLNDVNLSQFLVRWQAVHDSYLDLAEEIFERFCLSNYSVEELACWELLSKVIRSETMRGWVGKRSVSGLDSLLAYREEEFVSKNSHLTPEEIDTILCYDGIYRDEEFLSAEQELIKLITNNEDSFDRNNVLRNFCQYNVDSFKQKEATTKKCTEESVEYENIADIPINSKDLLDEIRALNYLNLNLEVKYSFKGFAGLMHILVFYACKLKTCTDNVYEMNIKII